MAMGATYCISHNKTIGFHGVYLMCLIVLYCVVYTALCLIALVFRAIVPQGFLATEGAKVSLGEGDPLV